MALLGLYVGMIPVSLGMLWLPSMRRIGAGWLRVLIAFTVGLLAFLAVDAALEGLEIAAAAPGGLRRRRARLPRRAGSPSWRSRRVDAYLVSGAPRAAGRPARRGGPYLALMVAIGIGLHNLGEGLAIGSAYAIGALALGAFLVVGFAIHNTTEGLAIVAPLGDSAARRSARLSGSG